MRGGNKMNKKFYYTRVSNAGKPYRVDFTVEVTPQGFATIEAGFSLRETLMACLEDLTQFVAEAMKEYQLGVASFDNRVNHGHSTHPINRGGVYYTVDGKMYRCDKHLGGQWSAPASDFFRILIALSNGEDKGYGLVL